jgi:hypothetical protein
VVLGQTKRVNARASSVLSVRSGSLSVGEKISDTDMYQAMRNPCSEG